MLSIGGAANQWLEALWMSCIWLLVLQLLFGIIIMTHNMNKMFKANFAHNFLKLLVKIDSYIPVVCVSEILFKLGVQVMLFYLQCKC